MIIKFFIGIGRHIRDAFRNFFRNFALSLSALASINVTLIVVSASIFLGLNFNSFASDVENDAQITISLKADITEEQRLEVDKIISTDVRVDTYDYSSKEAELLLVSVQLPGIEPIISQYQGEENPLFDVYYVTVNDIKDLSSVASDLKANPYVEDVAYGEDIINNIIKIFDFARIVTLVIIGSLLLVTVFIIYNTIRITVYTRSVQIEIMRLIGASNYHIRMPYIYEGVLIGLFGSILPIIFTVFGYSYLYNNVLEGSFLSNLFTLVKPYPITLHISIGIVIVGVVVGVFGSALGVRKFLKN